MIESGRELLEAAIIVHASETIVPPHVTDEWFSWEPARKAWPFVARARAQGRPVDMAQILQIPAALPVMDFVPQVHEFVVNMSRAVEGLRTYVDREWLWTEWRRVTQAIQETDDVTPIMQQWGQKLQARAEGDTQTGLVSAADAAMQVYLGLEHRGQQQDGGVFSYGWKAWDALTNGLESGQLIVVAARTGVGKTLLAGNMARSWAQQKIPVLYLSLEMFARKLMARWMAMESGLNSLTLARGRLHSEEEWTAVSTALGVVAEWPLWIWEKPLTLSAMSTLIREQVARKQIAVVIVDYAGLVNNPPEYAGETKAGQVGRLAQTLKNLAGELEIPIVALAQLSRKIEDRAEKVPILSDLRDSGDWEASADVVWMAYKTEKAPEQIQVALAKSRDGASGMTLSMGWEPKTALIFD